jgi:hypothetical protein
MYKHKLMAIGATASLIGATVWACGPEFSPQLLDQRAANLKAPPLNTFAFEAAHLVKPSTSKDGNHDDYGSQALALLKPDAAVYGKLLAAANLKNGLPPQEQRSACDWRSFYNATPCADAIAPNDLKRAITLYAEDAAQGSDSAVLSLRFIAYWALQENARTQALIDDPIAQRLLVTYAVARMSGELPNQAAEKNTAPKPNPSLLALVQAIELRGLDRVAGTESLAALAYKMGRFDLASTLANKSSAPYAYWIRAKLALRKGDIAAATAAYAAAARGFPKAGDSTLTVDAGSVQRMRGEQGTLALARGEFVEAMRYLYEAANNTADDWNSYSDGYDYGNIINYASDASYVAERVLTVNELKTFVDAHAPASPAPEKKDPAYTRPYADTLRWLLARRLMRAGRYADAQPYFPVSGDSRFPVFDSQSGKSQLIDLRAKALEYPQALREASSARTKIDKAEARYRAALIMRSSGMELFGYQQAPDFTDVGGGYSPNSGHSPDDLKQSFVTPAERKRFAASVAKPDLRFHYRYLAAEHASAAADLLPPHSLALASVLCEATGWMMEGPGESGGERLKRIHAMYARYLKQGAYVPWADDFGRNCEEPDFDAARHLASKSKP